LNADVWKKETFNNFAHISIKRDIYQPQVKEKHAYTHLISCDPTATDSINWFSHKFDLDEEFKKKMHRSLKILMSLQSLSIPPTNYSQNYVMKWKQSPLPFPKRGH
jgi:hypothetical protein